MLGMLAWSCIRGLRQFGEAIKQHNMGNHEFAKRSKHFDRTMAPILARFFTQDFILRGYIEDNAYSNNPHDLDELKINDITADISPMTLQAVPRNIWHHARLRKKNSEHFQNFLLKDVQLTFFSE